MKPLETEYRDVNDNRINFEGKTIAKVNVNGKQKHLEILITTKQTNPLLGLDWMKELGITSDKDNIDQPIKHVKEDPDIKSLKEQFKKMVQRKSYSKGDRSRNPTERKRKTDTAKRETNTDPSTTIG